MIMLNDLFDYGPKIFQDTDYFKFSIDSILLAEFAKFKDNQQILDICTGNAPIPLILATKNSKIFVDAVEIQPEVADIAQKSVNYNDLNDIIKIHNIDIKNYEVNKKYDVILCNPPYFKVNENSYKNLDKIKRVARHEEKLTLEEMISCVNKHLKSNGTFFMVHRVERFLESTKVLEKEGFGIRQVVFVFTKDNSNAEFFLLEASKCKKSDLKVRAINIKGRTTYKNIFKGE